jgi:tRNA pseudouridine55 synthase
MNGILVLNKPAGLSSARAVARVKRMLKAAHAGHTGTLDPFASGVLVCGINQATRLARFLMPSRKVYEGTLTLGIETDTQDGTGAVVAENDWSGITRSDVQRVLQRFEGDSLQAPPAYSALKHQGVPLYRLARQGRPVRKPPRPIHIAWLRTLTVALPRVRFEVCCSPGTYVRTLAADIGRELGCGGHLSELVRRESDGFGLDQALTLEELAARVHRGAPATALIPMAQALTAMPGITAGPELLGRIRHGSPLTRQDIDLGGIPEPPAPTPFIKVVDARGELAAVIERCGPNEPWKYAGVFMEPER